MHRFASRIARRLGSSRASERFARPLYHAESLETRRLLIASGETVLGTIGLAGESDDYTFTANAGDAIIAGVSETVTGSTLTPRLQLIAPGGGVLFNVAGANGANSSSFNVATSGTYTLRVTDSNNTQTGGYAVSLAKLPGAQLNSGDGGAVTSGEYRSGTIDVGDIDIYTIDGTAGGTLVAVAGELTGQPLDLFMNVVGPGGQSLYAAGATAVAGTTETSLPATGTYYVVVYDNGFNGTGSYNLTLASVPNTQVVDADSGVLTSGVRRTGTIAAADVDVYTVTTPLNGTLLVDVSEINSPASSFAPTLYVLSPTGALLFNQAGSVGRDYFLSGTAAGTYTIMVFDQFLDTTGDYAVTAVTTPGTQPTDADSGPISSGQYVAGTIDGGDVDVFTIQGTVNGSIVATVAETAANASFDPAMIITSPSGAVLFNNSGSVSTATTLTSLPATGTYTVTIRDSGADSTGSYGLTVVSVPGSAVVPDADSGPLTSGVRRTGSLAMGDADVYTISMPINGNLQISLSEAPGAPAAFAPQLIVLSPVGTVLFNQAGNVGRDFQVLGGASGTYTIVVVDQFQDSIGDYALTAVASLATQPTDADSGPISSGEYRTGSIDYGDVDVYTINGNAGGSLLVNLADSAGTLDPGLMITAPNGAVLFNSTNAAALQTLEQTLPASGTYTITVWDSGSDTPGTYGLTAVAIPAATQSTDADSGPITSGQFRTGTLDFGDIDVFTVNVSLGSSFLVTLGEAQSGNFNPQLAVFNPAGVTTTNSAGTVGVDWLQQNVTVAGTWVICVFEQFGNDTGGYNLTVVNGTGAQPTDTDSGPLSYAQYRQGTLIAGDTDVYTLSGAQTSSLLTELAESEYLGSAGVGEVALAIFAPNGALVRSTSSANGLAVLDPLSATGTYTIAVYEAGSDEFMRYGFTSVALSATFAPVGDGVALGSGQTVRGSLDSGDIDAFGFTATAGQSMLLSLQDIDNTAFAPNIVIATPTGATLINTAGANGVTYRAESLVAGTYKVFVLDQFGNDFGNYAMTVALSATTQPTTGDSGPLTTAGRRGEITAGDIDVYTVAATAGATFTVTLNETPTGQAFQPRVLIYRPDGTILSDNSITNGQTLTVSNPQAGTYTVAVVENGSNTTGTYAIAVGGVAPTTDNVSPRIIEAAYRYDRPLPELVLYASEDIAASLQVEDFTLLNTTLGVTIPTSSLSLTYEVSSNRILISAPGEAGGILRDGKYTLTLNAASINDNSLNPLDGNGDGTGSDNYALNFFVLAGDADQDGDVDFADLLTLAKNYNQIGLPFSQGNFDYDSTGAVTFNDLLMLAKNYGKVFSSDRAIADATVVPAATVTRRRTESVVSGVIR